MAKRTPPFHAYPEWTEARYWSFIRSGLRAMWSKWPPKYTALKAAKRPSQSDNKRLKHEFQCATCRGWFPQKQVAVDHIVPVGSLRCYEDLAGFVQRLFVPLEALQVLCEGCHHVKTQRERKGESE